MNHKILIIEDDAVINEMYALKLKSEWYEVKSAFNGLDGLTQVSEFHPDIILLDLMMPSMNGFETLEAIKSQSSLGSKIIIFTNVVDKTKINEAIDLGADDYLIKADTTPKDVLSKVKSYLGEIQENKTLYVQPGLNHFKMKNPNGGEDIDIEINIKL